MSSIPFAACRIVHFASCAATPACLPVEVPVLEGISSWVDTPRMQLMTTYQRNALGRRYRPRCHSCPLLCPPLSPLHRLPHWLLRGPL